MSQCIYTNNDTIYLSNGKCIEKWTSKGKKLGLVDIGSNIITMAINKEAIAVASIEKQIQIYDINLNFQNKAEISRKAMCVYFAPDVENRVLVGDRAGDVIIVDINVDIDKKILLGHISLLTTFCIAQSDSSYFIISADRDEHIRVSHYPDGYKIHSYCLGHKTFVTSLAICDNILLSGSFGAELCLWDWYEGKLLDRIETTVVKPVHQIIVQKSKVVVAFAQCSDVCIFEIDKTQNKIIQKDEIIHCSGQVLAMCTFGHNILISSTLNVSEYDISGEHEICLGQIRSSDNQDVDEELVFPFTKLKKLGYDDIHT